MVHFDVHCSIFVSQLYSDGGGRGSANLLPPTSVSSVTSANVRIGSQNFLTFSFNPFERLV